MIGWYVHHQGRGHLTRAQAVQRWLEVDVTVLSSLPAPSDQPWVELTRDDDCGSADVTANGRLHWVPTASAGLPRRMAAIADWIARARPSAFVVDVSVEVALLARLCGVPVIVVAGPGDRDDAPHQLCYDIATRIVAPWPRSIYDPPFLHAHRDKVDYVGAFSRFDDAVLPAGPTGSDVLALSGAGGTEVSEEDVVRAQRSTPGRRWRSYGPPGAEWTTDVWGALGSASVVVTHAGQNALAEVAAARRPAVIIPQLRPFDEQVRVATALERAGVAVLAPAWPDGAAWPDLLAAATALGGDGWAQWSSGYGAQRMAEVISRAAR